jgi:membrane protein implicated in regulation of membrane protease activity
MDMSPTTIWWVAAGLAIAAELATGTFYLLMIALGLAAGAIASWAGGSVTTQVVVAAVLGGATTAIWHWRRAQQPRSAPARENRDVNLDIGEQVTVTAWAADGTTRVPYRGTLWTARLQPGSPSAPGLYRVAAVEGNWLVLAPSAPPDR